MSVLQSPHLVTAVTLAQIWAASPDELRTILDFAHVSPQFKVGVNRVLVAGIYRNAGKLTDKLWVLYPEFIMIMTMSSDLNRGLLILKSYFIVRLLTMYGTTYVATDKTLGDVRADSMCAHIHKTMRGIVREEHKFQHAAMDAGESVCAAAKTGPVAAWRELLDREYWISHVMSKIVPTYVDFDPNVVVINLLKLDLSTMMPVERGFYLASIGELLQTIPPNDDLSAMLNTLMQQYGCAGLLRCVAIIDPAKLTMVTMGCHGHTTVGIQAIIGEYAGSSPSHALIIQRLRNMLPPTAEGMQPMALAKPRIQWI